MNQTLNKLFIKRYYEVNAAFFLLVLLALFGLLNAHDVVLFHRAIMTAITASWKFCGIAIFVMVAYALKCTTYCLNVANNRESAFLLEMEALPLQRRFILFIKVFSAIYLPVMSYSIVAAIVGVLAGEIAIPLTLLIVQLLICVSGATILMQKLRFSGLQSIIKLPAFNVSIKSRLAYLLLQYSFYNQKMALITIKIFSIGLLQIMISANEYVLYKESVCVLMMFLISAHGLLPQYFVLFSESRLQFLRNLPFSIFYRFCLYACAYALLFLPELAFLVINGRGSLPYDIILSIYGLSIAQLCLYTALLYHPYFKGARYTVVVVGMFFITLITMASQPVWLMAILEGLLSMALFFRWFGRAEGN